MYKILISSLMLLVVPTATLWADDFDQFKTTTRLFVEASDFYWDERVDGAKLLDETGIIYAAGLSVSDICVAAKSFKPDLYRLTFGGTFKYQFGTVDYDGQDWDGNPVQSDVDYSGFTFEPYLGALFKTPSPKWFVEPKLMLGYRNWSRDILGSGGYKEKWQTFYGKVGVEGIFLISDDYQLRLSGGALILLWAANDANILGYEVSVSPKPYQPTAYGEAACEYKRVGLAVYFEAFRFRESDPEAAGTYQPDSYEERIGLRLMVAFY